MKGIINSYLFKKAILLMGGVFFFSSASHSLPKCSEFGAKRIAGVYVAGTAGAIIARAKLGNTKFVGCHSGMLFNFLGGYGWGGKNKVYGGIEFGVEIDTAKVKKRKLFDPHGTDNLNPSYNWETDKAIPAPYIASMRRVFTMPLVFRLGYFAASRFLVTGRFGIEITRIRMQTNSPVLAAPIAQTKAAYQLKVGSGIDYFPGSHLFVRLVYDYILQATGVRFKAAKAKEKRDGHCMSLGLGWKF